MKIVINEDEFDVLFFELIVGFSFGVDFFIDDDLFVLDYFE